MARWLIFNSWLALCCGIAGWRGGAPERIGAAIFCGGTILTVVVASPFVGRFNGVETGILSIDIAMFAAFFRLALRSERFWPIWICGLLVTEILSHLMRAIAPELLPPAYGEAIALWSYPMLGMLLVGTVRHRRRLATFGVDASWKN
jgi:hypothetical protein